MATNEDLPRIEIQTLAADEEQTCYEKEVRRLAFCHITSRECDIVLLGVKWAWFEVSCDLH